MKKILAIFALLALVVATLPAQDVSFGKNDYFRTYVGVAGDTLDANTDLFVTVHVDKDYFYHVNAQIEADSLGNGADVTVKLQGSWDNSTFYDIGSSVTWGVTAADTLFSLNSFTALTETLSNAAHYIVAENTGGIDASDSLHVEAQTITYTRNIPGLMYPFLRVSFDGASGADMLLTRIRFRIIKAL